MEYYAYIGCDNYALRNKMDAEIQVEFRKLDGMLIENDAAMDLFKAQLEIIIKEAAEHNPRCKPDELLVIDNRELVSGHADILLKLMPKNSRVTAFHVRRVKRVLKVVKC